MKSEINIAYDPIDLAQYEERSAMIWASRNVRLPKKTPWDFAHRRWQAQIFDDPARELVIIKPTQIGMTTIMLCKMLHFATFHPVRVMYTLPRQDDVGDLVNGRLETMIKESPALLDKIGSIDNVRFKIYGNSYIHFMESSVAPRMLDVDCLVNDEVDLSNQDHLEQYKARLDASDYKVWWRLSTPSVTGFGIDAMFNASDKKVWIVKCPRCSLDQELSWEGNVKHVNGETWYTCSSCDKVFTPTIIQAGQWVAEFPSREVSGYSVSQLMVTSITPESLWTDWKTMRPKNFHNLRLGKPYTPSTGAITKTLIYDKCINDTHYKEHNGKGYFLGADQGNEIHVAIGRLVEDTIRIVHLEVIPMEEGFDRLAALMDIFQIRKGVLDALPNRHSANLFVSQFKGHRASMAFYTTVDGTYKDNLAENTVNVSRSMSFDSLFDRINEGKLWLYGSKSSLPSEVKKCVAHLSSMRRDEIISISKMGGERTEIAWVNNGADHFAHAINYLQIAVDIATAGAGFRAGVIGFHTAAVDDEEAIQRERINNNPYAIARALSRLRTGSNRNTPNRRVMR